MKDNEVNKQINSGIHLRVLPSTPYVLEGIENKLYVLMELKVEEKQEELDRPPYNLVMVLDKSGSMSGEKIKYAKDATSLILDNIHNEDLLHLVTYDAEVQRVFLNGTSEDKDQLKRQIKRIRSGSTTNLSGGLTEGQKILSEFSDRTQSKRVFLFSDGLANVGVTDEEAIFDFASKMHRKGINTTSFGIGKDFHEKMMMGIAENGHGDYFFIENADSIPHIVEEAIEGLLQTVATNMTVKVRGLEGAIVSKVYLHEVREGAILGDLREGETRRIIAEVKVEPSKLQDNEFITVDLEYQMADNLGQTITQSEQIPIQTTTDESLLQDNEEVMTYKVEAEVAEQEQEIYEFLGQMEFDRASQLNEELRNRLHSTSFRDKEGRIEEKLEHLDDMTKYIEDAKKKRDSRAAMKRSSYSQHLSRSSRSRGYKEKYREDDD